MPESRITHESVTSFTAIYRNNSNKYCKIIVNAMTEETQVFFYIKYKHKWVKTEEKELYGSMSGGTLLDAIIFGFPDCDLSTH